MRAFALRAALFDLDGTLVDTVADLAEACNRMLDELGLPTCSVDTVRGYLGKGIVVLVQRCLAHSAGGAVTDAQQSRAVEVFRRHYRVVNGSASRLYPGVDETLVAMRDMGLGLACVTNKPRDFCMPLLARMGLRDFFPVVVGGDDLPRKKPAPDMLLHACDELHATPEQTLMIGDSANDALAARAAGMPVVLTTYGYTEGVAVDTIDCDGLVSTLTEILPQLRPSGPGSSQPA